ncbi:MAG: hypothetical protein M3O46_16715 [Myxococcota bacterium]|nr:hypothetical protein [Myxococcota bacterium]
MRSVWPRWTLSVVTLAGLALASPVRADAPDPDVARIAAAGHSLKWNWTPPGRADRFGHAETLIHAPLSAVRLLVLDFGHYTELAPYSITTSRVVGHGPDGSTDVYLRMGVLNNMMTFWNVMRFAPLHREPQGSEIIEGQMVPGKGNIDDSAFVWTLRQAGGDWTVLKVDLLLRPGLPAPRALIDEQLRDSAMDAVNSIHDRAQGSKEIAPFTG